MKYSDFKFKFLLLTLTVLCASAQSLPAMEPCPPDIKGGPNTQFGIYIRNLETGEVVADINGDELFVPASVTKALTTASVLSQISPDEKFVTTCTADGKIDGNGVLQGNVVITCSGDPTLESSHFKSTKGIADSIAARIASAGIKSINGRVVFDYPYMLEEEVPTGWMNEDLIWPYGTAHHAVNYADNKMSLNLATGKSTPATSNLNIIRQTGSLRKKRGDLSIYASPGAKGSMAVAMPDPSDAFSTAIKTALENHGIEVAGNKIASSGTKRPLYRHLSPTYSEIMKSLMFRSDNLFAEAMLRTLAPTRKRASATQRELSLWDARGLNTKGIYIEDGSGLSRKNRISPRFLASVLEWMYRSGDSGLYLSLFPKAGQDGTMRNFMKDSPLEGRMATKTGSMRGVQCYAGYLLGADGKPSHVMVVMVNGFTSDRGALKTSIGNYLINQLNL